MSRSLQLLLLTVVFLALGPIACHRQIRPEMGSDRVVETGSTVEFGAPEEDAPEVTWQFNDGSEPVRARQVAHAFHRAGTYEVHALDEDGETVARVTLTVVPRPPLKAIPGRAAFALFIPAMGQNVRPLLDFAGRATGEALQPVLRETPPFSTALGEIDSGQSRLLDLEEGMGLFGFPGKDFALLFVGVADPDAALQRTVESIQDDGGRIVHRKGGLTVLRTAESAFGVFVDRGYLYIAIPSEEAEAAGRDEPGDFEAVHAIVADEAAPALADDPEVRSLQAQLPDGNAFLYLSSEKGEDAGAGEEEVEDLTVWGALRPVEAGRALELTGLMRVSRPIPLLGSGPLPTLFEKAPAGPIAIASFSAPKKVLTELVFGEEGTEARMRMDDRIADLGVSPEDARALIDSLRGDVAALLYLDAPTLFRHVILKKEKEPLTGIGILLEAGISNPEVMARVLQRWAEQKALPVETSRKGGTTVLRTELRNEPAEVAVGRDKVTVTIGKGMAGRAPVSIQADLAHRFEGDAFGPGHLSVFLDGEQLLSELITPTHVPGLTPSQLGGAKLFAAAYMERYLALGGLFFDITAEEGGARFRIRATLREKTYRTPSSPPTDDHNETEL